MGAILAALFRFISTAAAGPHLRRQRRHAGDERQQEENKLGPAAGAVSETAPKGAARNAQNSFDGISNSDPREFNRRFFTREERQMIIPGFGRPVIYLVILRQLNL